MAKVPDPPYIVAGAVGGPLVEYVTTPLRNALTLGASDQSATVLGLYRQVFRNGAFSGGIPMAKAAVPGFLVLGPAFHWFKDRTGGSHVAAVTLTAWAETMVFYGAETYNAQIAYNLKAAAAAATHGGGAIPSIVRLQNPSHPTFGIGFGLNMTRNVLAMSGIRVFSKPCQDLMQRMDDARRLSLATRAILGDLVANIFVSAASTPLHQLYGWSVTTRVAAANNTTVEPFGTAAMKFLRAQYLTPSGHLSKVAGRDMCLRVAYNTTIFTLFGFIERNLVSTWPASWQWPSST